MKHLTFFLAFVCLIYSCQSNGVKSDVDSTAIILKQTDSLINATKKEETSWNYSTDTDAMTSKVSYFAQTTSVNELSLNSPYDGFNQAHLTIRKRRGLQDAVLEVDKGQFIAGVYGTNVKIRFDKRPPMTFYCEKSTDYSPKILFIESTDFINQVKRSKKVLIEATFYEAGEQQMEFKTDSLKWDFGIKKKANKNQYGGIDYGFVSAKRKIADKNDSPSPIPINEKEYERQKAKQKTFDSIKSVKQRLQ